MPDENVKLVGLMGWPLGHSLSPHMHNAAFQALGMPWRYQPFPVKPEDFSAALQELAAMGLLGLNLTIPYKQTILPHLDSITPEAERIGAVNTVVFNRHAGETISLHGANTDADGFIQALRQSGYSLDGKHKAMVIGSGGAARAVLDALLNEGIRDIAILNRSVERAERLCADFRHPGLNITVYPLEEGALLHNAELASLLVNTTPVGTWPAVEESVWPDHIPVPGHLVVFDLVYNPLRTRLLRQAENGGAITVSGLEMLVQQGGLSFQLWTGIPAPLDIMRDTCRKALGGEI